MCRSTTGFEAHQNRQPIIALCRQTHVGLPSRSPAIASLRGKVDLAYYQTWIASLLQFARRLVRMGCSVFGGLDSISIYAYISDDLNKEELL